MPEVWCYRAKKRALWFGALDGDAYRNVDRSLCLPLLTPTIVLDFLAESERLGETKWDVWMRREMEALLRPGD